MVRHDATPAFRWLQRVRPVELLEAKEVDHIGGQVETPLHCGLTQDRVSLPAGGLAVLRGVAAQFTLYDKPLRLLQLDGLVFPLNAAHALVALRGGQEAIAGT